MNTNPSPEMLTAEKKSFMSTLDEYQRRRFLATEALSFGRHGVRKVSHFFGTSKNTLYKGIKEIRADYIPEKGHVRHPGGGRKAQLPKHPEWIDAFRLVVEPHMAGLPQDENVLWVSLTVSQIRSGMASAGYDISEYHVRQILKTLGFRKRSFIKDLPMLDVKERNAQFIHIADIREHCAELGIPILSIDTKKKEFVGNFKRSGIII